MKANTDLLDNAIWHALNSHHRHLAILSDVAARYQPDIVAVAAVPSADPSAFDDIKNLVEIGEITALFGEPQMEDLTGWELMDTFRVPQMVCKNLRPTPEIDAFQLTTDDVPDMLNLVALAQPGPFSTRTIEMGLYLGIRKKGQLIAMAGQRIHLTEFCEISAVCTHPDYRKRGYAGALTSMIAQSILDHQETPFLHLDPTNISAMRLYANLGFEKRKDIPLSVLKRTS